MTICRVITCEGVAWLSWVWYGVANIERLVTLERALDKLGGGTFDCEPYTTRMYVGFALGGEILKLIGAIQEGDKS